MQCTHTHFILQFMFSNKKTLNFAINFCHTVISVVFVLCFNILYCMSEIECFLNKLMVIFIWKFTVQVLCKFRNFQCNFLALKLKITTCWKALIFLYICLLSSNPLLLWSLFKATIAALDYFAKSKLAFVKLLCKFWKYFLCWKTNKVKKILSRNPKTF